MIFLLLYIDLITLVRNVKLPESLKIISIS